MDISILEYLGKYKNGILVLLSIKYKDKFYNGTFFYTDKDIVFTVDELLEKDLGCKIKEYSNYLNIIKDVLKKVVPYKEISQRIDDVDFTKWNIKIFE